MVEEELRAQICAWLRANGIDPNLVPIDTETTLGEWWLGVDVYPSGPDDALILTPSGGVLRETRRFVLRIPPEGRVLDWLRRDQQHAGRAA